MKKGNQCSPEVEDEAHPFPNAVASPARISRGRFGDCSLMGLTLESCLEFLFLVRRLLGEA